MRFLLTVAILVGALVSVVVIRGIGRRVVRDRLAYFADWSDWDDDRRWHEGFAFARDQIRSDAFRWQVGWTVIVATLIGGALSLVYISEVAERADEVATQVCEASLADLQARDVSLTEQIRALQVRRDELADQILRSPSAVESVPSFAEMDPATRSFIRDLLAQEISQSSAQVTEWDGELADLRVRVDEVRALERSTVC